MYAKRKISLASKNLNLSNRSKLSLGAVAGIAFAALSNSLREHPQAYPVSPTRLPTKAVAIHHYKVK